MADLIDILDAVVLKKDRRPKSSHYPSEATTCKRQVFYRWLDIAPSNPVEAGALWKMMMGNAAHKLFPPLLREAGAEVVEEETFEFVAPELKYPIRGRVDCLFRFPGKPWEIFEAKSSHGRGIVEIQRSGAPRPDNYAQLSVYLEAGLPAYGPIDTGHLVYLGRDNCYRTAFVVKRGSQTASEFADARMRFQIIERAVERGDPPDREYHVAIKNGEIRDEFVKRGVTHRSDWQCRYCGHARTCWADQLERYASGDNAGDSL